MFNSLREVTSESIPPVDESTFIYQKEDGTYEYFSRVTKGYLENLIEVVLPAIKEGKGRLIAVWIGQYRADAFEITPNVVDIFEEKAIRCGRIMYSTFKH